MIIKLYKKTGAFMMKISNRFLIYLILNISMILQAAVYQDPFNARFNEEQNQIGKIFDILDAAKNIEYRSQTQRVQRILDIIERIQTVTPTINLTGQANQINKLFDILKSIPQQIPIRTDFFRIQRFQRQQYRPAQQNLNDDDDDDDDQFAQQQQHRQRRDQDFQDEQYQRDLALALELSQRSQPGQGAQAAASSSQHRLTPAPQRPGMPEAPNNHTNRQTAQSAADLIAINELECPICSETITALGGIKAMTITQCCNQLICKKDETKIENRARELYRLYHDHDLRREYAANTDTFTGWPSQDIQDRQHAECPLCRHYPLQVRQATLQDALREVQKTRPATQEEIYECNICYDEKPDSQFAHLHCNHKYCKDCMQRILDVAIRNKNSITLRCPERGCNKKLTQKDIREITDDRDVIDAIADIETQEFLAAHSEVKHCPTPNCTAIFFTDPNDRREVQCPECRQWYCPQCLKHHDASLTCQQAKAQARAAAADSGESNEYIQLFTKPCPNCTKPIEKTEGCRAMTCSQCKGNFCWDCLTKLASKYDAHPCIDIAQQQEQEKKLAADQFDYLARLAIKHKQHAQAPTIQTETITNNFSTYYPQGTKRITIRFENPVSQEFIDDLVITLQHKQRTHNPYNQYSNIQKNPDRRTITLDLPDSTPDEKKSVEETINAIFRNVRQPSAKSR